MGSPTTDTLDQFSSRFIRILPSLRVFYLTGMRVALIHDWSVGYAGSERVVEQILELFPEADLYMLLDAIPESQRDFLKGRPIHTSFLQRMPWAHTKHRLYLPIMPYAVEQFALSGYELVISSSHAVAKGVITGPDQLHICYCHTPIRYAWDLQHQYLEESKLTRGFKSTLARLVLHYMRIWDVRTTNGVDVMVANSKFIARRIWKAYRREAVVIPPPVDVENFTLCETKEDFYLAASRMVPYKRMDVIVEAFAQMPDRQLVVIGDGPEMAKIRAKATPNIQLLGYQPFSVLRDHMQRAKAFVFAAEEDFGIISLEAQACGTPVIAYGRGGSAETILNGLTGLFFAEQSAEAVKGIVRRFEQGTYSPKECRQNAERFSAARFREAFSELVSQEWEKHKLILR